MSKELIFSVTKKDMDIKFFSGTGAGGQHRNKHQNCVKMTHRDSGVTCTGQSSKSRESNLREAFKNITKDKSFLMWLKTESSVRLHEGITLEDKVNRMMQPQNLRIDSVD